MHLAGTSLISAATYYLPISTNQAATKTVSTVNLLMSLPSEALRAGRCPVGHSHHLESIWLELRSRLSAVDCGVSHNNITPPPDLASHSTSPLVDAQESKELGHPQQLQHFPALLRPSDRSVDGVHTGPFHQYGIEP